MRLCRRDFMVTVCALALMRSFANKAGAALHGSPPVVGMPAGASGIWYAADYVSTPRKTIPNSVSVGVTDPNQLNFPRRSFANAQYWQKALATITDDNATAPDGSTEASTVVFASGGIWKLFSQFNTTAGIFTVAVSVRAVSGTPNFDLGDDAGTRVTKTASGSWQRFSQTFTAASAGTPVIRSSDGVTAGTFEVCDFQLFAGSSDLNANALTAKPLAYQNADLIVGRSAFDLVSAVSSGALQHGSIGHIAFPADLTPSAHTVIYVAERKGAYGVNFADMIVACADGSGSNYNTFSVGLYTSWGHVLNGTQITGAAGVNTLFDPNIWDQFNSGPYVGLFRYDGTTEDAFVNNTQLMKKTITRSAIAIHSLFVGAIINYGFSGCHDIYALAFYNRALTNAEVIQAYNFMKTRVAVTVNRIISFEGDSITVGGGNQTVANYSYPYRVSYNFSPPGNGVNFAVTGNSISNLVARSTLVDALITGSPSTKFILSVAIGTNDFGSQPAVGAATAVIAALSSYCDARRAAGWLVVVHTLLSRTDGADGGVRFNVERAAYNTAIRSWVGVHADAISDIAADATIGTDAAPNNPTYWNADKIHPINAAYVIWEPITRAAINGL